MKHIDYKFSELCEEVDHWRSEAKYWQERSEELQLQISQKLNDDLDKAKKGVGQMLMLAMSIDDKPDGSIGISKDNRKTLSKVFAS